MFTQCTNCQAIYRVSMREVTVSKGFLRCGECLEIFDSSENLSPTMQEPFTDIDIKKTALVKNISPENIQTITSLDDWQSVPSTVTTDTTDTKINLKEKAYKKSALTTKGTESKRESKSFAQGILPKAIIGLLIALLIFQLIYSFTDILSDEPKYDHSKIHMLNHNVFAHPIDKGALLISASIENTAEFDQAFPILEVRLTNSKSELVALRRFSPDEYLDDYSENKQLIKNRATSIKLKIQDPGNQATRFQFDFL